MNIQPPVLLTQEQLMTLEQISDGFVQSSDLSEALLTGLNRLLQVMGRSGAALYIPTAAEIPHLGWYFQSTPPSWQRNSKDNLSPIFLVAETSVQEKKIIPGDKDLMLGAAIPLLIAEKSMGSLLIVGDAVSEEEYKIWQIMLRPFARQISLHNKLNNNNIETPGYQELLRSRNTLRAMFDSLPISIYIIDNQYELVAVNNNRANRAGYIPRQIVRRKCYESLYNRNDICPGCRVAETFSSAVNTVRISRQETNSDAPIEWEISTFPILDENDLVSQAIIIEQDVTEKRNLEANLIQSEKLAAVGQLAAGVAHEINNPLTAIIANAQLLHREIPTENVEQLDSIKLIEMAGTRASQVVRNLLGIARKEKYDFEPVDLNETIQNALSLVQHELVGRPIRLELNLSNDMPSVFASQDQLQGVWINLILNALDALDKPEGLITIRSQYTGPEFLVTITDNGKGIALDHLPRVFEPFFTTKSPGRGTGLGLSVCMRAVKHHGGTIHVDSQPGEWTRFTISLPAPR